MILEHVKKKKSVRKKIYVVDFKLVKNIAKNSMLCKKKDQLRSTESYDFLKKYFKFKLRLK